MRIAVPRLSESARRRRTLEQRIIVRFPGVYRLVARTTMRARRSPLRRLLLARAVALAYAASNRRDFDAVLVGMDLERYEYRPARDLMPPDVDPVFHGRDGYLRLWRYWLDAFGDIRWEPEEILDFGVKFLVKTKQRGRGSGSGVALSEAVFQLFTLRDGLIVRQEDFVDRAEALRAAAQ